ncbi:hypothetical protein ACHAQA_009718 [Verticillium albo-atrum]
MKLLALFAAISLQLAVALGQGDRSQCHFTCVLAYAESTSCAEPAILDCLCPDLGAFAGQQASCLVNECGQDTVGDLMDALLINCDPSSDRSEPLNLPSNTVILPSPTPTGMTVRPPSPIDDTAVLSSGETEATTTSTSQDSTLRTSLSTSAMPTESETVSTSSEATVGGGSRGDGGDSQSSGISTGTQIGIGVGVTVGVVALLLGGFWLGRKSRKAKAAAKRTASPPPEPQVGELGNEGEKAIPKDKTGVHQHVSELQTNYPTTCHEMYVPPAELGTNPPQRGL